MQIVVASSNIFRRELTIYLLGEAGYSVAEATSLDSLLALLLHGAPDALVLDTQLGGVRPSRVLEAIRACSPVPILWIADAYEASALIAADAPPAESLAWPYSTDELRTRLALLLARSAALQLLLGTRSRSVGAAE